MSQEIIKRAGELGFIKVGFSPPVTPPFFNEYESWLAGGKNADMAWLERHAELRKNPSFLLEDCRTVISLAYPYSPDRPGTPDGLGVSRYSEPDKGDYHKRLRILCNKLVAVIKEIYRGCDVRVCIDSAPILERSFAYLSGIGFIGKNNMLIMPGYGSYFYLAEILTTAEIDVAPSEPIETLCGSCTLCMDSCPCGALETPFCLDAARCLSYLTIEKNGPVDAETGGKMGDCFLGCDRCQEVCPYNEKGGGMDIILPSSAELLNMDEESFKKRFGKSALARAGFEKIKSNIRAIIN
jgi:epoxyqueuosine reductase